MEYSQLTIDLFLKKYPYLPLAKNYNGKWSYDFGVVLQGMRQVYERTREATLFHYIKDAMDYFILETGEILHYDFHEMNLDHLNNGKILLFLYQETGELKYRKACNLLYQQIQKMPRNALGGFWHKKSYPHQMWLDGLYMHAPFYAEYEVLFNESRNLADIYQQFELCYRHLRDQTTGLYYHGWDYKKVQNWADFTTGLSNHFWGRAMGWFVCALVDTIEVIPNTSREHRDLQFLLKEALKALSLVRDSASHVWYQVLDEPLRHGNYLEASASSLITYAYAKAYHLGVLSADWVPFIRESFAGLIAEFVLTTNRGELVLIKNCEVAGLGGRELRDGSFVYYVSEPIISNDFKGLGAFLQASEAVSKMTQKGKKRSYLDELFNS
jgi:unsaturated rhamnogalacturonyl hydrolase